MYRWHTQKEHNLVQRRWRKELATHVEVGWGFMPRESMVPASYACDVDCHCAAGQGTMRKRTLSGHHKHCLMCNGSKYFERGRRGNKLRAAIRYELEAEGR